MSNLVAFYVLNNFKEEKSFFFFFFKMILQAVFQNIQSDDPLDKDAGMFNTQLVTEVCDL